MLDYGPCMRRSVFHAAFNQAGDFDACTSEPGIVEGRKQVTVDCAECSFLSH
jgi:hypothetical protein